MRNPDWIRDEVILAMDLYFRCGRKQLPAEHEDVIQLSKLLNRLPIHLAEPHDETFRNPNGISMILGNFLGVDPDHQTPGLSRNNRLHESVWQDFAANPVLLRQAADAIERAGAMLLTEILPIPELSEEEMFEEGMLLTRLHIVRERNREAVKRKKEHMLAKTGRLECEVCDFDFARIYGSVGEGFAECHHVLPLSQLPEARATRLTDLAIVCANCHRMLHRIHLKMTVFELRNLVRKTNGADTRPPELGTAS